MLMEFLQFMVSGFWQFIACVIFLVFVEFMTVHILNFIQHIFIIIFQKENKVNDIEVQNKINIE